MNWGPSRWEGTNAMGDQWDGGPMEWAVCGCQLGDQWGPVRMRWGTIGIGRNWVDEWKGGPIWCWGLMNWGTNEKGTNELGDQWDGGPMSRGTNEMGDQWNGWCMGANWGTNEMGNQWDGGPMRWGTIGIGRWWGDEWKGGPMRWGTSDMGDQWDGGPMSSNNVLGDQWVGGPMRRGPMRWGTNEMGDQWADPTETSTCQSILSGTNASGSIGCYELPLVMKPPTDVRMMQMNSTTPSKIGDQSDESTQDSVHAIPILVIISTLQRRNLPRSCHNITWIVLTKLPIVHRLFHAPTRTTSSGCFMLHRTVHALWNLYGNPYRNRAETEEETIP